MQVSQSLGMRMDQRQLLTPRMIQSMEILQLPLMALEERIEQEMQNNPVLELREGEPEADSDAPTADSRADPRAGPRGLQRGGADAGPMKDTSSGSEDDFDRLARISDYFENEEFNTNGSRDFQRGSGAGGADGERDKKMDAMNNTASRSISLQEHLLGEWAFIEATPEVKLAGEAIIANIDGDGYFRREGQPLPMDEVAKESKRPLTDGPTWTTALKLVQTLEPSGVGARNLRECLLIQLNALARTATTRTPPRGTTSTWSGRWSRTISRTWR